MSSLARTLARMVGLVGRVGLVGLMGLTGLTACLKPNPLAQIDLAGDDDDEATDTGTSDDPLPDLLPGCEPPTEIVPECGVCLGQSCCTSLEPCGDDPICVCEAACVFAGDQPSVCRVACSSMLPGDPEPLAPLLQCAEQLCPDCFVE